MKQNKSTFYRISIFLFFVFLIILSVLCYYNYSRRVNPNEIFIFSAKNYRNDKPVTIFLFAEDADDCRTLKYKDISLFIDDKPIPSIETKSNGIATLILNKYPKYGFTIRACLGELSVEKHIELSPPLLLYKSRNDSNKPKMQLQTDKPFYAPGEIINAKVEGLEPQSKVKINTSITISGQDDSMFGDGGYSRQQIPYKSIKAVADTKGKLKFKLKLPEIFGRMKFDEEDSVCKFSLEIILPPDKLGIFKKTTEEKLLKEVIISTRPLRVNCLPEFNDLIYRQNNNIYVFVSDPAKNPLAAVIKSKTENIKTDKNGIALLKLPWKSYKNKSFIINAASQGKTVQKTGFPEHDNKVVIKTDKLIYNYRDKIRLNLFLPNSGGVIVNLSQNGISCKFFQLKQKNRRAYCEFEIPKGMSGLIQISAYMVSSWGKRIRGIRIIQVGEKSYFTSQEQMVRARFEAPVNTGFEAAMESAEKSVDISNFPEYYERKEMLRKEKSIYGRMLFWGLLAGLFVTFILLFWDFMRTCFNKTCFLLVPDKTRKKIRDNIFIAALGYCFSVFLLWKFLDIVKTERINIAQIKTFNYSSTIFMISYLLILGAMIWKSFYVRGIILKETENESGNRVRKSIFLLPYLFVIFVLFQHSYLIGLMFHSKMNALILLFWFFQMLAIVWFFYVYGIIDFLYTKEEYELMYGGKKGLGSCLGTGIGIYRNSFYKTWIWGGIIYWGVPIVIYFLIFVIILSMFLPLMKICSFFFYCW